MYEIKAYACGYNGCKKALRTKQGMKLHESKCFYNPDKKACTTCDYYENTNDNKRKCHHGIDISDKPKNGCNKYTHCHGLIWGNCYVM
ncbi:MAG: hypothetical protein J6572_03725 [Gilliamella sp.]|nr:hypothetical protein [Gilliamella sp.]